jgi:Domain of unknown function (DUF6894)
MPRFYFHLSAHDQNYQDKIGSDLSDLAAAHSRAVHLANRVIMFSALADCAPDFRRWTVKITDERGQPVITVIFPSHFESGKRKAIPTNGPRSLLLRLDATMKQASSCLTKQGGGKRRGAQSSAKVW